MNKIKKAHNTEFYLVYLSIISFIKNVYSASPTVLSSASTKHNGGNNTHHQLSPSIGSKSAYLFWDKVINDYTNGNNKFENGIFEFENIKKLKR